ncbi:NADPH-dependent 1-acyldihydroxyacetone phosphate reductase [Vanrija pseudolonga]|uniref:NADPH-dependent 1-acyldihydroxyacetone phosphate reductase n=1 Tax=Vanrija pseudolonga TaxID=143232 RepID=A0AAF0YAK5_9TREE|nr:NADPH-dependent 1-acyldihydroxyacetone phosphate reductase [Vanrija pseudolonga]
MTTTTPRVALVTGCSEPGSLGAQLALSLAKEHGFRVFATARNTKSLAGLAAEGLDTIELDVTKPEDIAAAVKTVKDATGRLDVLVNNAGVAARAPLLDTDLDGFRRLLEVNLVAPLAITQAFAPLLVAGAEAAGQDAVVLNVGSASAWGTPFVSAYGATKAALHSLSDSLRRETAALHIKVITVELSTTQTPMGSGEKEMRIVSSTPSGLYDNWDEIDAGVKKAMGDSFASAPKAGDVARRWAAALASPKPPRRMWDGYLAWAFRYLFPLLPVASVDRVMGKSMRTDLVRDPLAKA